MRTQYHWIKKPPFSTTNHRKLKNNYQTFYSDYVNNSHDMADKIQQNPAKEK